MHPRTRTGALTLLALLGLGTVARLSSSPPSSAGPPAAPRGPEVVHRDAGATSPALVASADEAPAAWVPGELLVRLAPGAAAENVAADHGLHVARAPGYSGLTVLGGVQPGDERGTAEALLADPRVAEAAPNGIVRAASMGARATPEQWHLDAIRAPGVRDEALATVVVAVLDSGVAYQTGIDEGVAVTAALSLQGVPMVSPWDFVDDDEDAVDHQRHGTHVATSIAGVGPFEGTAPGVSLMPVRVLDANGVGTEAGLVDGIHWAVDHGADVINLSLALSVDYVPSVALRDALTRARDEGVVVVAATGNGGYDRVVWPAASPSVVAVGASAPSTSGATTPTWYSNRSGRVDLLAPGGEPGADANRDGLPDGVLAETMPLGHPESTEGWYLHGTSQAAALVSGAAALLLAHGAEPDQVPYLLQQGASGSGRWSSGGGAGELDVQGSLDALAAGDAPAERGYAVSILPWLTRPSSSTTGSSALLTVVDAQGQLVPGVTVYGTARGVTATTAFSCVTGSRGTCTVTVSPVTSRTLLILSRSLAWSWTVETVVADGVGFHPEGALFVDPAFDTTVGASARTAAADDLLAFRWTSGSSAALGAVNGGTSFIDAAVGAGTLPTAVAANGAAYAAGGSSLSLGGALSLVTTTVSGLVPFDLGLLDALNARSLGFTVLDVYDTSGTGLADSPMRTGSRMQSVDGSESTTCTGTTSCEGAPILLDAGEVPYGNLSGTALDARLASGGWVTSAGTGAATAMLASGTLPSLYAPAARALVDADVAERQ